MKLQKWKKSIVTTIFIVLLINNFLLYNAASNEDVLELSTTYSIGHLNPHFFYDVDVLLISRQYGNTELVGYHENEVGKGSDEKITLFGEKWWPFHIFIIVGAPGIIHRKASSINTKIEFISFNGWMFGHDTITLLQMIPLKLYGHCDMIKITVYRG